MLQNKELTLALVSFDGAKTWHLYPYLLETVENLDEDFLAFGEEEGLFPTKAVLTTKLSIGFSRYDLEPDSTKVSLVYRTFTVPFYGDERSNSSTSSWVFVVREKHSGTFHYVGSSTSYWQLQLTLCELMKQLVSAQFPTKEWGTEISFTLRLLRYGEKWFYGQNPIFGAEGFPGFDMWYDLFMVYIPDYEDEVKISLYDPRES